MDLSTFYRNSWFIFLQLEIEIGFRWVVYAILGGVEIQGGGGIVSEVEMSELLVGQFSHKNNWEAAMPMGKPFNIPNPPVVILLSYKKCNWKYSFGNKKTCDLNDFTTTKAELIVFIAVTIIERLYTFR